MDHYVDKLPRCPYIQLDPTLLCIFCNTGNHMSHNCYIYKSSNLFWEKVLQDRRCKNCLRLYHRSNKCYNKSFCVTFGCRRMDKHSPVLCRAIYAKYQPCNEYTYREYWRDPSQHYVNVQIFLDIELITPGDDPIVIILREVHHLLELMLIMLCHNVMFTLSLMCL